jgi:hypothetical protein
MISPSLQRAPAGRTRFPSSRTRYCQRRTSSGAIASQTWINYMTAACHFRIDRSRSHTDYVGATCDIQHHQPGAAPPGTKDGKSSSLNQLGGPFDWTGFECPDCEASWSRYRKRGLYIIHCSCGSLFCGSEESKGRGLTAKDSGEGKEWWWRCPNCKIEQRVQLGIEAVSGQTMKGK